MRACLAALRWTQRGLAAVLGCDEGLVRRWARDSAPIPPGIAQWLAILAEFHRRYPPPGDWRRRSD